MSAGTSSGGAYYATAVQLRQEANAARASYAEATALASDGVGGTAEQQARLAHANNLIRQATSYEVAAALYCVAQAIEDSRPAPILRKTEVWTVVPRPGETL